MGAGLGGCGAVTPFPCRVHLSPVLLQPGLLGKLCCFGTGKGKDWQTGLGPVVLPSNPRLWHSLVLLCAHGCALCFGKPCWKCLSPTPTWALWPQPLWQLQAEPLQVPGQASSHHSEAFGCSWHSPACCSRHSFCVVKPQQLQLCPWEGQESSVVPVTQVLLACVKRHILA